MLLGTSYLLSFKELLLSRITQPPEVALNTSIFVSVSFCMFPCSKGHSVRAYLDTILKALSTDVLVMQQ